MARSSRAAMRSETRASLAVGSRRSGSETSLEKGFRERPKAARYWAVMGTPAVCDRGRGVEEHAGRVEVDRGPRHRPGPSKRALALVLDPGRVVGLEEGAGDGDDAAREEALVELPGLSVDGQGGVPADAAAEVDGEGAADESGGDGGGGVRAARNQSKAISLPS